MKKGLILLICITSFLISPLAIADTIYNRQVTADFGYDLVAYQTQNEAIKGNNKFYVYYKGVTYLFANQKDKDLFLKSPEKYLPAYGGYCAMAMTMGKKHLVSPKAFKVVNGKLYLNKADARAKWLTDIPGHIKEANKWWAKIKNIDPAKVYK